MPQARESGAAAVLLSRRARSAGHSQTLRQSTRAFSSDLFLDIEKSEHEQRFQGTFLNTRVGLLRIRDQRTLKDMRPTAHSALRHCFYFPILHTSADLGCIAPQLDKAATDAAARERRRAEIDGIWADIEKIVLELDLDFTKTQVYQDGLPICGWEAQIVDELARTGSLNHRLLQALRERGATLMGTESPELLTAEHQLAMQVLDARGSAAEQTASQHALAADLLERRDRFIARRIDETLPPGHTGLLFIGALHRVALFLPTDIVVTYPIGMPR